MQSNLIAFFVFCFFGCICVIAFLIGMFIARKTLLPEEYNKIAVLTAFPYVVRFPGLRYNGPFSRISVYGEFMVLRILGASRIIQKIEITNEPYIIQSWLILDVCQDGINTEIKIYVNNNEKILQAIKQMK